MQTVCEGVLWPVVGLLPSWFEYLNTSSCTGKAGRRNTETTFPNSEGRGEAAHAQDSSLPLEAPAVKAKVCLLLLQVIESRDSSWKT